MILPGNNNFISGQYIDFYPLNTPSYHDEKTFQVLYVLDGNLKRIKIFKCNRILHCGELNKIIAFLRLQWRERLFLRNSGTGKLPIAQADIFFVFQGDGDFFIMNKQANDVFVF